MELISSGRRQLQVGSDNIGRCKDLHTVVLKVNSKVTHSRLDEECRNQSSDGTRFEPYDFAFQLGRDIDGKSSAWVELQWPDIGSRWL